MNDWIKANSAKQTNSAETFTYLTCQIVKVRTVTRVDATNIAVTNVFCILANAHRGCDHLYKTINRRQRHNLPPPPAAAAAAADNRLRTAHVNA